MAIKVAAGAVVGAQPAIAAVGPGISLGAEALAGADDGHLDVPITMSAPSSAAVSVVYSLANETAVNTVDYNCATASCVGTVVFAPGQTSQTLWVGILNDAAAEPLESFNVVLSSRTGASITRAIDKISIVDDDKA